MSLVSAEAKLEKAVKLILQLCKRRKYLINKAWKRTGPGGPTGLQNAFARFSCVM